ncbi:MAG: hypothetical protein JWM21_37 [Acidobacteria bacterium]|nr:hypothetical protein [Acidobacteriota bacterium]
MRTNKLLRKIGGFIMAAILLSGVAIAAGNTAQAQGRGQRRVVIVRPYGFYRPYNPYRSRWYGRSRFGYDPFGYDSFRYNQYVFDNGERAMSQGYHDGFKTGESDGKKSKSFSAERSHYFHDAGFGNYSEAYRSGFSRGYREGYYAENSGAGR